jgi:hypothetical protein
MGGGSAAAAPVFTLTSPASGVAIAGMTFELVGAVTQSVGRQVTSATLDIGDGVARPIAINGTTWRVTVPLAQSVEETRSFTLSALDVSAQTTTTMISVRIDTLGPRTALTVPTAGTVVGSMAALQGTATDPASPLMLLTVDVGDGPQMASIAMSGAWQVIVTFPPNLDYAIRTATIRATDLLGNQSTQTAQLLVDTRGPTLALTSPASGTAVGGSATLSGTTNDSTGPVSGMTVNVGSGQQPVTVQADGTWSAMVTFPPNLDRVSQTITLRAQDALGNVTTTSAQVLVDTQGPTLSFTAPASMERLGNPRTQVVTGSVGDSSGVASVQVNCADGIGNRAAAVTSGSWSFSWMLPTADNASFVCTATALDSLANATVVPRTFLVDTVGPVVTILNPASGALLGGPAQSSVQVQASVNDGSGALGSVNVSLGSTTVPVTGSAGVFSNTFTLPVVDYQPVSVMVVALDAEGNTTSSSLSVTVDRVGPVVSFTAPSGGQTFNIASFPSGNDVQMTWTVSDGDPMAGTRNFNGSAVAASSRSAAVTTSATDNAVTYSRTVDAIDRAGNVSAPASRSFMVDRVRPTVTASSPAAESRMNDPRVSSVSFSEPMNTSVNGLTGSGGSWDAPQTRWTSNALAGSTVFNVAVNPAVTDLAGNAPASFPSWRFHTAPMVPANGSVVASNILYFDAASDVDGQVFIGLTRAGQVSATTLALDGTNGTFSLQNGLALPTASYSDVHVQVHSTIGTGLNVVRTRAINGQGVLPSALAANFRTMSVDDGAATDPGGLPIVSPPIEATDGSAAVGLLIGQTYSRNPVSVSLAYPHAKVIPSGRQWVSLSYNGASLAASHRRCGRDALSGNRSCIFEEGTIADGVQSTVLRTVSGAVSNTGCLIYSYDSSSGRRARSLAAPSIVIGSVTGASYTSVAAPGAGFTVATRTAGGHWGAWVSGSLVQISRTTNPATCTSASLSTNWTPVGTVDLGGATSFRVVQLGASVGVVYLAGSDLRIAYP